MPSTSIDVPDTIKATKLVMGATVVTMRGGRPETSFAALHEAAAASIPGSGVEGSLRFSWLKSPVG
ncbi:unannotated protein [freshwater metagenome]|uniref:Unannotated protein n=1 Tax=freshwater metagenome TaxID=449393 RepID=A0A6J6JE86_9ZZZZ